MKKILFSILFFSITALPAYSALQKLTVMLDAFPNPNHAPLIVAKAEGFFIQQGLDVSFITPSSPEDSAKYVSNDKADIGLAYEPAYFKNIEAKLPIIAIGTLVDKPLNCLVTLKASGIDSIFNLKNKRIAYSPSGITALTLKHMLLRDNLTFSDIHLTSMKNHLVGALISHKVDAITGIDRNYGIAELESAGHKVNIFFPEDYNIPNYSELIYITKVDKSADPRFPKFLSAVKKAVALIDSDQGQTWNDFIKLYPELNNKINHATWFNSAAYFAENPARIRTREWEVFLQFMLENKLIKQIEPMTRYVKLMPPLPTFPPKE